MCVVCSSCNYLSPNGETEAARGRSSYDWKIHSISNKSTKKIYKYSYIYTIARKKIRKMHIFKGRVKGKERNGMAAI